MQVGLVVFAMSPGGGIFLKKNPVIALCHKNRQLCTKSGIGAVSRIGPVEKISYNLCPYVIRSKKDGA